MKLFLFISLNLILVPVSAQKYEISSADKNIGVSVEIGNSIAYSVTYKEKPLLLRSEINMFFQPDIADKKPEVSGVSKHFVSNEITPVIKEKRSVIPDIYNELILRLKDHIDLQLREPQLMELLGQIPTTWDETIILNARLGKYIVEARRNGNDWYIAAINDWTPQTFSVSLSFLKEGIYDIESAADGINAARNPQDYKINGFSVKRNDTLTIKLAPGGGFISRLKKK